MRIGRLTVTAVWTPRPPRFQDLTQFVCTGCGWWFAHLVGDHWRGAYHADPERPSGQYPEPGQAREITWEALCELYADCCDHLVPLADPRARCPDCAVPLGQFHDKRGCDLGQCVRSGRQYITCPQTHKHDCAIDIWTGHRGH